MKKKIYEIEQYEIKDLKQKLNEKQSKIIEHLRHQKKKKKNFCVHVQNGSNQQRRIEKI